MSLLPVHQEVQTLRGEVERLRHVANIHSDVMLLARSLVYEADIHKDTFTYISPHAEQLTGFPLEQWRQDGAYSFMLTRCYADDVRAIQSKIDRFLQDPSEVGREEELTFRWKDRFGQWRFCNERFQMLFDSQARRVRIIGCIHEVTEQVEVARLRRAWMGVGASESHAVAANGQASDQELLPHLLDTGGLGLTKIQRRILELVLVGMSNKQIALRLHRSIRTIEDHRSRIMRRLGAKNSFDLVRKILESRSPEWV